jgi:hypothetical protein
VTIPDVGPQLDRAAAGTDPRGILVFSWLPTDLQSDEDSTQAADRERSNFHPRGFERPATDAEILLLEHLGYAVPDDLTTFVTYRTRGIWCRTWPQLETESPS